jgi:hypothetical protein
LQAGCHRFESVRLHHTSFRHDQTAPLVLSRPVGRRLPSGKPFNIVQRDNQRCRLHPREDAAADRSSDRIATAALSKSSTLTKVCSCCAAASGLEPARREAREHAGIVCMRCGSERERAHKRPFPEGPTKSFFFRIKSSAIRAFGGCLGSKRR